MPSGARGPKLPRVRKAPLTKRPFRIRTLETPELGPLVNIGASLPERMVATWLTKNAEGRGLRWGAQIPELGYQAGLPGSAKVDFEILNGPLRILLRVNGDYWHLKDAGAVAKDSIQRMTLSRLGTVVDVWEEAVYADLDGVMKDALNGIERPPPNTTTVRNRPRGY